MKKSMIAGAAVLVSFFLLVAAPGDAAARGRGAGQGSPGQSGPGVQGHSGHRFQGHSGHRFHGFRGHHGFPSRVFVGIGPYWGPYWGWGPSWYPPYYYPPAYAPAYAAPVVAEPLTFIHQSPPPTYWYFCESAKAYYPYVQECPAGWLTVVPPAATDSQKTEPEK